jgi:hypothetical protein
MAVIMKIYTYDIDFENLPKFVEYGIRFIKKQLPTIQLFNTNLTKNWPRPEEIS